MTGNYTPFARKTLESGDTAWWRRSQRAEDDGAPTTRPLEEADERGDLTALARRDGPTPTALAGRQRQRVDDNRGHGDIQRPELTNQTLGLAPWQFSRARDDDEARLLGIAEKRLQPAYRSG